MTATELIAALENGQVIGRDDYNEGWEYLFLTINSVDRACRLGGWGSALGKPEERFMDIVLHPNNWKIGRLVGQYFVPNDC